MKDKLEALVNEMINHGIFFEDAVREFEKRFILNVLEKHRGNICKAAAELRIHRNTLSKKISSYNSSSNGRVRKPRKSHLTRAKAASR